jgi:hypothetical protein
MSVGTVKYRIALRAPGWLGKWLSLEGFLEDSRSPIMVDEFVKLQALYLVEAEEEAEAMERAKNGGG